VSVWGLLFRWTPAGRTLIGHVAASPPDQEMGNTIMGKLAAGNDFHLVAGYHGVNLRREVGDPARLDLVALAITSTVDNRDLQRWAGAASRASEARGNAVAKPKGPRLAASQPGND
jgi:hypothetical protein